MAAAERIAGDAADAGVEDHRAAVLVHFRAMRLHVGPRAEHALLFAAEQNEADGAARQQSAGFDGARGFDHQRGVAAVVQRAGAEFPGIQMRAENDDFVGLFVAANFADHIELLHRAADFVGHGEAHADFAGICRHGALQAQRVFARDNRLGEWASRLAIRGIGVAIEQFAFALAGPKDCGGAAFTARSMIGGGASYSRTRSCQV